MGNLQVLLGESLGKSCCRVATLCCGQGPWALEPSAGTPLPRLPLNLHSFCLPLDQPWTFHKPAQVLSLVASFILPMSAYEGATATQMLCPAVLVAPFEQLGLGIGDSFR
jgi:hypothetical protein